MKSKQHDRMIFLNKSLEKSTEIYLENDDADPRDDELLIESNKFRNMVSDNYNAEFRTNFTGPSISRANQGKTVNSIIDDNDQYKHSSKSQKFISLQPKEALEISIKRALSSGGPINGISFYDEINWSLNNLGFDSKSPLDIKEAIINMIS